MPSPAWTTPDQAEFLESKLADFQAAQRNKTTQDFWKVTYREFFERWTDPQDEIPALTVPKKRKRQDRPPVEANLSHTEWVQLRKNQIANWFNNRRNGVSHRRHTPAVVIGNARATSQRILSEINLYSKKYYNTRVRDRVAEAWKAVGTLDKRSRIVIINQCLSQCWQEENDEIKAEIRQEYERLKELRDQPIANKTSDSDLKSAESYAGALVVMPEMIRDFLKQLKERTGFVFMVLGGGPDANRPGRMRTFAFHEGVDCYDQNFGAAYGSFRPNIMEPFNKFLYNVYSEKDRSSRVVTNDQKQAETAAVSKPEHIQKIGNVQDENKPPKAIPLPCSPRPSALPSASASMPINDTDITTTSIETAPSLSDTSTSSKDTEILYTSNVAGSAPYTGHFDPTKEVFDGNLQSIEENSSAATTSTFLSNSAAASTASFSNLDFNFGNLDDFPFTFEEFEEAFQALDTNSWDIPVAQALDSISKNGFLGNTLNSETSTPALSGSVGTHRDFNVPIPPHPPQISFPALTPSSPSNSVTATFATTSTDVMADAITNNGPYAIAVVSAIPAASPSSSVTTTFNTISTSVGAGAVVDNDPPKVPILPAETSLPAPGPSYPSYPPIAPATAVTSPIMACAVSDNGPPASSTSIPTPPLPSPAPESTSLTLLAGATGAESFSQPDVNASVAPARSPLVVADLNSTTDGGEERLSRIRKPATSKEVQPSAWLDLAHTYLLKDIEDEKWKACIEQWYQFEKEILNTMDTNSRRVSAKGRPALLSKWVGTRNYGAIPKVEDEEAFAHEWIHWWNEIQPKWRRSPVTHGLPLPIDAGSGKDDLSGIKKGGPTGLVVVLIGLKWWTGRRSVDGVWDKAVADIAACLSYTGTAAPCKKKRVSSAF